MSSSVKEEPVLRSRRCARWSDYWFSLKSTVPDGIPTRAMFDPSRIVPLLPYILIHDLSVPDRSTLRLVGTGIVQRLGVDPTGSNYLDLVEPGARANSHHHLLTTARHPCGMRLISEVRYRNGKITVAEALGFPLYNARTDSVMMMFLDDLVEQPQFHYAPPDQPFEVLRGYNREYIDVGFGVPNLVDMPEDIELTSQN